MSQRPINVRVPAEIGHSKDANFRLIVNGPVGVKEIERLIKKLELENEILAEKLEDDEAAN